MSKSSKVLLVVAVITSMIVCSLVLILSMGFADCSWHGIAIAYIDANKNGHFDGDDSILPNVAMHVDDIHNHYTDVAHAITDEHGMTHLDIFIAGCPTVDLEVYADTPAGYRPTTLARIKVRKDIFGTLDEGTTYYFGFAKLK